MKVEFKRVNQNPVSTKTKGRCDLCGGAKAAKPMMEMMNPTEQGIRQPADGDDNPNVAALLISIWHFLGNILMHL